MNLANKGPKRSNFVVYDLNDEVETPAKKPRRRREELPTSVVDISPVDPMWQNIDPTPDIRALFISFDTSFFGGKLASVEVRWSKQMTLCAGVCSYQPHAGFCSIRLSEPLLKYRPRSDLVETLLHEMIHAYLFVTQNDRDRESHGPNFLFHMNRINKCAGTNITVYHSFHDEVESYRVHVWRCNGPCMYRPPFFGYVRRSRNRAPGPNDLWWSDHQTSCSGQFVKVSEPENYRNKSRKAKLGKENAKPIAEVPSSTQESSPKASISSSAEPEHQAPLAVVATKGQPVIPFSGTGQKLGGGAISAAPSRIASLAALARSISSSSDFTKSRLGLSCSMASSCTSKAFGSSTHKSMVTNNPRAAAGHPKTNTTSYSPHQPANSVQEPKLVECPVCPKVVPVESINEHLDLEHFS